MAITFFKYQHEWGKTLKFAEIDPATFQCLMGGLLPGGLLPAAVPLLPYLLLILLTFRQIKRLPAVRFAHRRYQTDMAAMRHQRTRRNC